MCAGCDWSGAESSGRLDGYDLLCEKYVVSEKSFCMWEVLRLIRIRTIAFAALTMYTMRYMVILPMLELNGFTLQMADWAFTLLVVAVCCLISGAYVINDYFDTKCDRISGFRTVVVGKASAAVWPLLCILS